MFYQPVKTYEPVTINLDEFNLLTSIDNPVNNYKNKSRKSDSQINELITGLHNKGISICRISAGAQDYFRIPDHDHKQIKKQSVLNYYQLSKSK